MTFDSLLINISYTKINKNINIIKFAISIKLNIEFKKIVIFKAKNRYLLILPLIRDVNLLYSIEQKNRITSTIKGKAEWE